MARSPVVLRIHGLREVRAAAKALGPQAVKEVRDGMKGAASSVVVSTRSRMPAITGDARSSVRVVSRGNSIVVAAGSARAPYYGWLDFGGTLRPTGRRRNTITRPRVKGGRYLFPAIKANESRIVRDAEIAFEVAKRKVGF